MKVAVVGSRTCNPEKVADILNDILPRDTDTIISGGAAGADTGGALAASRFLLDLVVHKPDWEKHGKSAGYKRNVLIAEDADACIAFWDGKSKGTRHTIDLILDLGKPLRVVII